MFTRTRITQVNMLLVIVGSFKGCKAGMDISRECIAKREEREYSSVCSYDFDDEVGDFKNIAGSALEVLNFFH